MCILYVNFKFSCALIIKMNCQTAMSYNGLKKGRWLLLGISIFFKFFKGKVARQHNTFTGSSVLVILVIFTWECSQFAGSLSHRRIRSEISHLVVALPVTFPNKDRANYRILIILLIAPSCERNYGGSTVIFFEPKTFQEECSAISFWTDWPSNLFLCLPVWLTSQPQNSRRSCDRRSRGILRKTSFLQQPRNQSGILQFFFFKTW